jgi:hypothetical protein
MMRSKSSKYDRPSSSRLLKKTHMLRCRAIASPLDLFEQPARGLSQIDAQIHSRQSRNSRSEHAGSGSLVAANYVYNVAMPDGLTLANGAVQHLYMDQRVGQWPHSGP